MCFCINNLTIYYVKQYFADCVYKHSVSVRIFPAPIVILSQYIYRKGNSSQTYSGCTDTSIEISLLLAYNTYYRE